MTSPASVLLATCAEVADLDDDARCLLRALESRGAQARPATWDDTGIDWAAADLVIVRTTWDYARRRDEFLAWAARVGAVTHLENPADVLSWNTDKTYLRDLADQDVAAVPTQFIDQLSPAEHQYVGVEHVVKPVVSAGSLDTTRVDAGDIERSSSCIAAILSSGRSVMVQPYLADVDELGETAMVFIDGQYSHALRKGPLLTRGHDTASRESGLFVAEQMTERQPSATERDRARQVMDALVRRVGTPPLYARIDLLPSDDGPLLLELELAEPSLFLDLVDETAADTMAAAALARITNQ